MRPRFSESSTSTRRYHFGPLKDTLNMKLTNLTGILHQARLSLGHVLLLPLQHDCRTYSRRVALERLKPHDAENDCSNPKSSLLPRPRCSQFVDRLVQETKRDVHVTKQRTYGSHSILQCTVMKYELSYGAKDDDFSCPCHLLCLGKRFWRGHG